MTKEKLEARKLELERDRETVVANYHAITGAINDVDYWLGELAKAEAPPVSQPE